MYNLGFWGMEIPHFVQIFIWLAGGLTNFLNYMEITNVNHLLVKALQVLFLLRALMINAKYAIHDKTYMNQMQTRKICFKEQKKHYYIFGWRSQIPEVVDKYLCYVIQRQQLDLTVMWIQFMGAIPKKVKRQIQECQSEQFDEIYKVTL